MSPTTLTEQPYEIREGLTSFGANKDRRPHIEGLVNGWGVVIAFEAPPDEHGHASWWLSVYHETVDAAEVSQPSAIQVGDADTAREWVTLITALYAKAAASAEADTLRADLAAAMGVVDAVNAIKVANSVTEAVNAS